MDDPLIELLYESGHDDRLSPPSSLPAGYTARLSTLSVPDLTSSEPAALEHDAQSLLRSLQALAKRSHRSISAVSTSFRHVRSDLPNVSTGSQELRQSVPALESAAATFSDKYSMPTENPALERRRRITRLNDNLDRVSNVLELPALLQSTISASAGATSTATAQSSAAANANYASALDLHAHIKRLQKLYPDSPLVKSIAVQADEAMQGMTTRIISTLRSQNLKLAAAMRLIGLLRRIAPELDDSSGSGTSPSWSNTSSEGSFGALFLVCRLANLTTTLDALEPLKDLADQETAARLKSAAPVDDRSAWAAGQQTERYLKRYIEVYREQCFAMVSMFKSIFPNSLPGPGGPDKEEPVTSPTSPSLKRRESLAKGITATPQDEPLQQLPSALATFSMELVEMLTATLKAYLPNVRDQSSRDSLLTQFLYCAGSLGRLGGDFGMMLAIMCEDIEDGLDDAATTDGPVEWVEVMKRHRVQAGRLELLASGVGTPKSPKTAADVVSPG